MLGAIVIRLFPCPKLKSSEPHFFKTPSHKLISNKSTNFTIPESILSPSVRVRTKRGQGIIRVVIVVLVVATFFDILIFWNIFQVHKTPNTERSGLSTWEYQFLYNH